MDGGVAPLLTPASPPGVDLVGLGLVCDHQVSHGHPGSESRVELEEVLDGQGGGQRGADEGLALPLECRVVQEVWRGGKYRGEGTDIRPLWTSVEGTRPFQAWPDPSWQSKGSSWHTPVTPWPLRLPFKCGVVR